LFVVGGVVTWYDDHHFSGTFKHMYRTSNNDFLVLGGYGSDEKTPNNAKMFDGSFRLTNEQLDSCDPLEVTITLTKTTTRHLKTIWTMCADETARIFFVDDQVPNTLDNNGEALTTRMSFWGSMPLGSIRTEASRLLADWKRLHFDDRSLVSG
jgi:hypothetical protein